MLGHAIAYHAHDIKWIVIVPIVAYFNARMSGVLVPSSFSRAPEIKEKSKDFLTFQSG